MNVPQRNLAMVTKITDYKTRDWDFVYTYLPEHTLQLENHFNNMTNSRPIIFGYDAYIEIPKTTGYESSLLRHHYAGLMSMNSCGVNSQAVKDTIIEHAPSCLPDKDVEMLKDRFYLSFPNGLTFNYYLLFYTVAIKRRFRFFPLNWGEDDQVSNLNLFNHLKEWLEVLFKFIFQRGKFLKGTEKNRDYKFEVYSDT